MVGSTVLVAGMRSGARGMVGLAAAFVAAELSFGPALAEAPTEVSTLAGSQVTLYLHPFLTEEELVTLRLVTTNEQALSLFVASRKGNAALAISESDGFIRDGKPAASATALADLETPEAARDAAIAACDAARKGDKACVVVLEVGPAQ
jgi:hypothetical protein